MDPRHLKKIPLVLFMVVWGMVFFGVTTRNTSWVFWIHRIPGGLFGIVLVFIVSVFAFSAAAGWGAASAGLAMLGLGVGHTLALVLLARLVHPYTVSTRRLHIAQRVAGIALVAVGLFFAWQATSTGVTVGPTLP